MTIVPQDPLKFVHLPDSDSYVLADCSVPLACTRGAEDREDGVNADDLLHCDIHVQNGRIKAITPPGHVADQPVVRLEGACVFPTFVDLHTHIGAPTTAAAACASRLCGVLRPTGVL